MGPGGPVTITPDAPPSQGQGSPVAITPDAQPQAGMLSQAWDAVKSKVGDMAQHAAQSPIAQSVYDVSTPNIAGQLYKKLAGQPNDLEKIPGRAATAFFTLGTPEGEAAEEATAAARPGAGVAPQAEASSSGMLSRALEVGKRRISNLPGVKAVKDAAYIIGGDGEEAAPAADTPPAAPSVPDFWGKGRYGTPVDMWGKRIPQTVPAPGQAGQLAASIQQPSPTDVAPGFQRGSLQDLLDKSLGAKKLEPNVPLRQQLSNVPPRNAPSGTISGAVDLPEGHTAIEGSSAATSKMYDPDAREFHARFKSGNTTYVYGDVDPDEAQAFDQADSKGKALQDIKNNHPLVAKIENGKRIPMKAARQ
jgi:hypothetical protein